MEEEQNGVTNMPYRRTSSREPKPTPEALAERIQRLKAARSAACGKVTAKTNSIQIMMKAQNVYGNLDNIERKREEWDEVMTNLKTAHTMYIEYLSAEDRDEDAKTWAAPIFNGFEAARMEIDRHWQQLQQEEIEASDSISQVNSYTSKVSRSSSHRSHSLSKVSLSSSHRSHSSSSSVSRAKADAAAKKAELLARAAALKKKRSLEEQISKLKQDQRKQEMKRREEEMRFEREREEEERRREAEEDNLRHQQAELEIETELAVADARMQALDEVESVGSAIKQMRFKEANNENNHENSHPQRSVNLLGAQPSNFNPYENEFSPLPVNVTPQDTKPVSHGPMQNSPPMFASPWQQPANSSFDMLEIIRQQNELIKQQSNLSRAVLTGHQRATLPRRTLTPFNGDPTEYNRFIKSFEHEVEDKTESSKDRLYYLEQFTTGEVNRLVRSFFHVDPEKGYREAKLAIAKRFGNKFKMADAFMQRAQRFPEIKSEDADALNSFSLFLMECLNAMEDLDYMTELNHSRNIQLLVRKLPYKLRVAWRSVTDEIQEEREQVVKFSDLVKFVSKQARIASNPIYGNVADSKANDNTKKSRPHRSSIKAFLSTTDKNGSTSTPERKGNTSSSTKANACLFCSKDNHALEKCQNLQKKPIAERLQFLKENKLCFGCLKQASHMRKDCRCKLTCIICKRHHPTVLHEERRSEDKTKEPANPSTTCGLTGAGGDGCRPAIIPVILHVKETGRKVATYAFLDDGSDAVFCTERLRRQLKVEGRRSKLCVRTITEESLVESIVISGLEISDMGQRNMLPLPEVYTQEEIPAEKEDAVVQKDVQIWPYLATEVQLPPIIEGEDVHVGLLIGNNAPKLMEPLRVINSQKDGPYACETMLGWAVYGLPKRPSSSATNSSTPSMSMNRILVKPELEQQFINMYNQDFSERTVDDVPQKSREDQRFLDLAGETIKKVNGHYEISLPLRNPEVKFPINRCLAEHRVAHLKAKFRKNPQFCEEYVTAMKDTINKEFAEEVPEEDLDRDDGKTWYIPHHGVYHPQKGKLRVVFDCAAVYHSTSLNKELLQGPDMTNSLVGVLLRFRKEPVAVTADIEGMFNQVHVPIQERDLLRFLWWPDGDISQPLKEYRMKTHLFGATSSPSCANYALRRVADDCKEKYVADTIRDNFYVDDCLKSVESEERAMVLCENLRATCKQGGFKLTKWMSNSRAVIDSVPEADRAKEVKSIDLQDNLPTGKVLGVLWSAETDTFGFKINLKDQPATRRGILSTVSSIYDPLGFVSPVVLPAKQIIQDLCRIKLGWDENIPTEHLNKWKEWTANLSKLENFSLGRCLKPLGFENPQTMQLHHFSDASQTGYGTASYWRSINYDGTINCQLLLSKSRVAPLKQITIPRMELTAATVAVKVDAMLRRELRLDAESFFWTDSTSVLQYINNESARFHTFVANRISMISEGSQPAQWRYVPTSLNPADECSRGLSIDRFLKNDRWTNGPDFLSQPEENWPNFQNHASYDILEDDPEVKRVKVNVLRVEDGTGSMDTLFSHYSSWYHLKRAVAWLLRVKKYLLHQIKKKEVQEVDGKDDDLMIRQRTGDEEVSNRADDDTEERTGEQDEVENKDGSDVRIEGDEQASMTDKLTVNEINDAEIAVIKYIQRKAFPQEMSAAGKVKKASPIYKLRPFIKDGTLRVGGRLAKAALPEETKFPVILPKESNITESILHEIHETTGHGGRNYMLAQLHMKYWVINANSAVRRVISKCVICRKQRAKVVEQQMADLPAERVQANLPPFTNVGMDYFGPFYVKIGRSSVKRYGVIFTCLSTRAIHIEKADSLDTSACINVIRRFMARRGQVKLIRSDNGTNMVGAEKELRAEIAKLNQAQIHKHLLRKNITWKFNAPAASHHGGVWERQIRSIRKVLCSVVREQMLTDDNLHTWFCEVESILNSRPITKASEDINDLEALTPNHLLLLKGQPVLSPNKSEDTDNYTRRRWKQVQYLANIFWHRWIREYLPSLQQRQKWVCPQRNVQVGDIVLVIDDTAPRNTWQMGRVIEVRPDKAGLVRQVQVQTKSTKLIRPVAKLCLLLEADGPDQVPQRVDASNQAQPGENLKLSDNGSSKNLAQTRPRRRIKPRKRLDLKALAILQAESVNTPSLNELVI